MWNRFQFLIIFWNFSRVHISLFHWNIKHYATLRNSVAYWKVFWNKQQRHTAQQPSIWKTNLPLPTYTPHLGSTLYWKQLSQSPRQWTVVKILGPLETHIHPWWLVLKRRKWGCWINTLTEKVSPSQGFRLILSNLQYYTCSRQDLTAMLLLKPSEKHMLSSCKTS